jgi:hypothetical protein
MVYFNVKEYSDEETSEGNKGANPSKIDLKEFYFPTEKEAYDFLEKNR